MCTLNKKCSNLQCNFYLSLLVLQSTLLGIISIFGGRDPLRGCRLRFNEITDLEGLALRVRERVVKLLE